MRARDARFRVIARRCDMRLSEFILARREQIVAEWEAFAATLLPAAENMTSLALRDHANEILTAIAKDLETPQTREQQSLKSRGNAPQAPDEPDSAAQIHAVLRARSGFDIVQLVAEYRALRASVLRLWLDAVPEGDSHLHDTIRFNEAVDQAVAESVGHFHASVEHSRNLFLGMLGHDLRSPLTAVSMGAMRLATLETDERVSGLAARMLRSAESIQALLDDLADFNRTQLGLGLMIRPEPIDLAPLLDEEVEQLRDAFPDRPIELTTSGEIRGEWDGMRLRQVLRNLTTNALKYGESQSPVRITATRADDTIRVEVRNDATAGEGAIRGSLANPIRRGLGPDVDRQDKHSLGLGLFIVNEIVDAHGGNLDMRSQAGETVCSVELPCRRPTEDRVS